MAGKSGRRRRRGRNSWSIWKKLGIILGGGVVAAVATVAVFAASKMTKIETTKLDTDKLNIAEMEEEVETGYVNVALFGLDSRENTLGKGNLSDTMIIASLNKETKEIRMVSIYRDTLLQLKDGSYNKANAAYSFYGPEGAINLINNNLDMNIEKYVSVNFNALVDVIDAVGGLDLHLTAEEVVHMNNYCVETSKVTGAEYTKIDPEVEGDYHLNGVQSVSYSRIRYTAGGDFERTSRQRKVISLIAEKAQNMSLSTINKIIDSVFPQVSTNFTLTEMVSYAKDIKKYKLGDSMGFPEDNYFSMIDGPGSVVVADTLSSNVLKAHQFLFGNDGYAVSDDILRIEREIVVKAAEPYTGNTGNNSAGYGNDNLYNDYSDGTGSYGTGYGDGNSYGYGTGDYGYGDDQGTGGDDSSWVDPGGDLGDDYTEGNMAE